jgi:hypothetical protein
VAHGVGHAQASDTALTLGSGPTMHSREGGYIKEREGEKGSERREDDAEQEGGRRKKGSPVRIQRRHMHLLPDAYSSFFTSDIYTPRPRRTSCFDTTTNWLLRTLRLERSADKTTVACVNQHVRGAIRDQHTSVVVMVIIHVAVAGFVSRRGLIFRNRPVLCVLLMLILLFDATSRCMWGPASE